MKRAHRLRTPIVWATLQRDDGVTISASHITFGDLLDDRSDPEALLHHLHDVFAFERVRSVIEIENAEISKSAVDARMIIEIDGEKCLRFASALRSSCHDRLDVSLTVLCVVATRCRPIAVSAGFLESVTT